jgi:hypothetical protein
MGRQPLISKQPIITTKTSLSFASAYVLLSEDATQPAKLMSGRSKAYSKVSHHTTNSNSLRDFGIAISLNDHLILFLKAIENIIIKNSVVQPHLTRLTANTRKQQNC